MIRKALGSRRLVRYVRNFPQARVDPANKSSIGSEQERTSAQRLGTPVSWKLLTESCCGQARLTNVPQGVLLYSEGGYWLSLDTRFAKSSEQGFSQVFKKRPHRLPSLVELVSLG